MITPLFLGACSSAATLPVNIEQAKKIGIPDQITNLVVLLGLSAGNIETETSGTSAAGGFFERPVRGSGCLKRIRQLYAGVCLVRAGAELYYLPPLSVAALPAVSYQFETVPILI